MLSDDDEEEPFLDTEIRETLILDGLPSIPEEKLAKFIDFLVRRVMEEFSLSAEDFDFPISNGKTTGCAFLTFPDAKQAEKARHVLDGKAVDKMHKMRVTTFSEFDDLMNASEPMAKSSSSSSAGQALSLNLKEWLLDSKLRDQFVVRRDAETEVFWHDPYRLMAREGRELVYGGERQKAKNEVWTKSFVQWSPQGTYLATFHDQGIMLWGGPDFQEVARFSHKHVRAIDFSPNEGYLVTWSDFDKSRIIIWDILMQSKKREFEGGSKFKWSFDDKYFARVGENKLQIYETPGMNLLGNKSVKVDRVHALSFSPNKHLMAYWAAEQEPEPATIAIMDISTKQVVREQHVFTGSGQCPKRQENSREGECSVSKPCSDCRISMYWQKKSEYLAVKLCKRKTKRNFATAFHIFRTTVSGIPVEMLPVPEAKESGSSRDVLFAWEPNGVRFALAYGTGGALSVGFYKMQPSKVKELVTLPPRPVNELHWSPRGGIILLAGTGALNGQLEFYDVTYKESIVKTDHFMCNSVEWDPSGRFVCTAVCSQLINTDGYRFTMENGYRMWTMDGTNINKVRLNACYQIIWRPRPEKLLTVEETKNIRENLKTKYWDQFVKEDEEIEMASLSTREREKKAMEAEWRKYREQRVGEFRDEAACKARRDLRGGEVSDDDEDWVEIEELEEEEISIQEEIVGGPSRPGPDDSD
eukprot:g70145.t1